MYQQGFSLIELLMGLAIAAIVLPWAGSGYKALVESTDRDDAARLLASGLRSARSEDHAQSDGDDSRDRQRLEPGVANHAGRR